MRPVDPRAAPALSQACRRPHASPPAPATRAQTRRRARAGTASWPRAACARAYAEGTHGSVSPGCVRTEAWARPSCIQGLGATRCSWRQACTRGIPPRTCLELRACFGGLLEQQEAMRERHQHRRARAAGVGVGAGHVEQLADGGLDIGPRPAGHERVGRQHLQASRERGGQRSRVYTCVRACVRACMRTALQVAEGTGPLVPHALLLLLLYMPHDSKHITWTGACTLCTQGKLPQTP